MALHDMLADNSMMDPSVLEEPVGSAPNGEITRGAMEALTGNWGLAVMGFVLYQLFILSLKLFVSAAAFFVMMQVTTVGTGLKSIFEVVSTQANILLFVIQGPIAVGFWAFFLGVSAESTPRLEDLFTGFRRFFTSFFVVLLMSLFVFLWSLLLVVPGIIASYRYSMAYFVIADDPEAGPLEALRRSKEMMVGHKWKLCCLQVRFMGWGLLCLMTLGIGYLWLVPYMMTSYARFYEDVRLD